MASLGKLFTTKLQLHNAIINGIGLKQNLNFLFRSYAARKGTREKARKKKIKVEVKKEVFVPYKQRKAMLETCIPSKRINDLWKQKPIDDVWVAKYNQLKIYSFVEALQCHRETHDPTIYNVPNGFLNAFIELDMKAEKKYVDNIYRIAAIPHAFEMNIERTVIVFTKDTESQKIATKAGATLVGGTELIKSIQNGDIQLNDYQFVIAHPNILPELVSLRGIMKKKFPNPKSGTLGIEIFEMVQRYLTGIQYSAEKNEHEQDYAAIDVPIGTLNMPTKCLEENFHALVRDIESVRPKRSGEFITRCFLTSAPSSERLKIDLNPYLNVTNDENELEEVAI